MDFHHCDDSHFDSVPSESIPVEKNKDDEVIGGSINKEACLVAQVDKTGDDSYLNQVVILVQEAQDSQSKTQDLTNRAAKWLFYIALLAGFVTLAVWLLLGYPSMTHWNAWSPLW